MTPICCTRHPPPTTKNHKHTYDSTPRLLCARESFVLTHKQTRQQQHHHHQNHHSSSTAAAQLQHSNNRDCSRRGGDLTSPVTMYAPGFKNKGKRQTRPTDSTYEHFPQIRIHNEWTPLLSDVVISGASKKLQK